MFAFLAKGLTAARSVLDRFETSNPHTAGQVRMSVGGVLVADGLVGLENPFDGKKTRPGILGAVVLMAIGGVFVLVGSLTMSSESKTDAVATGTITDVNESIRTDSDRTRTCSLMADFVVDGQTYTAASNGSSSTNCRQQVGGSIEVRYVSTNPADAYVGTSGRTMGWIAMGVGGLVALIGLATFLIRAASIGFGLMLLRSGRAMTQAHPKTADDAGIVTEAKQAITNLLQGRAIDAAVPNAAVGAGFGAIGGGALGTLLGSTKAGAGLGALAGGLFANNRAQGTTNDSAQTGLPVRSPFLPAETSPEPQHSSAPEPVAPPVAVAATPAPTAIAPGWYATADGLHERWHDGADWTDHTRPSGMR